jgi:type IV pilus assembly protein PilO
MAKSSKMSTFDASLMFDQAVGQFRGLNSREPGQWPMLPKIATWLLLAALVVLLFWFLILQDKSNELEAERNKEPGLRKDFRDKLAQAVNLPELRKQKKQVEEYVTQLEKQLPGKAEMDALLTDINQAGVGRNLQFELFRPGSVAVRDYYAELPISIRVTGRYHDVGAFTADIANLSRIVTLHELSLSAPRPDSLLSMDAVARTYRYLDSAEVAAQKKPGAK